MAKTLRHKILWSILVKILIINLVKTLVIGFIGVRGHPAVLYASEDSVEREHSFYVALCSGGSIKGRPGTRPLIGKHIPDSES